MCDNYSCDESNRISLVLMLITLNNTLPIRFTPHGIIHFGAYNSKTFAIARQYVEISKLNTYICTN